MRFNTITKIQKKKKKKKKKKKRKKERKKENKSYPVSMQNVVFPLRWRASFQQLFWNVAINKTRKIDVLIAFSSTKLRRTKNIFKRKNIRFFLKEYFQKKKKKKKN